MGKQRASRKTRGSLPGAFEITLPATSANLGPAFDCAALALRFFLAVRARRAGDFSIRASGRDADVCGALSGNLVLATYRDVLSKAGRAAVPLAVEVRNQIPIGKGCGSSAAARLAGIALAVHFGRLDWRDDRIQEEAARREGHADNAAACWLGGVAMAHTACGTLSVAHVAAPSWPLLLAIPPLALATEEARAVLPAQIARADAVANVQSAMLLATAFAERQPELLRRALTDRLHQPYRARLCPLLEPLRSLAGKDGIIGAVLSGAGPSVLLFPEPRASQARVRARAAACLRQAGLTAELLFTQAESRGARDRRKAANGRGAR